MHGKPCGHRRSFIKLRLNVKPAAMFGESLLDRRQAKPHPKRLRGEEWFFDLRQVLLRNARTIVRADDFNSLCSLPCGNYDTRCLRCEGARIVTLPHHRL